MGGWFERGQGGLLMVLTVGLVLVALPLAAATAMRLDEERSPVLTDVVRAMALVGAILVVIGW